ncbi:MAG: 1-phosphofructokinase [Ruminococcaceae bacterium]|nr:1-phosphofructokinase [Oscillospiraceae bacterium]
MIYTLTCNPALDYLMQVDDLRLGETNRSGKDLFRFGGKGINVSAVLSRLGVETTALGFVAGFTGDALCRAVCAAGIPADFIRLTKGHTRVNVKLQGACETEINAAGPTIPADALTALYGKLSALTMGDTLVLAGSIPASLPQDLYGQIMALLSGRGVRFVVDATGEQLLCTLCHKPFLIKPNRRELEGLVGRSLSDDASLVNAARQLQDKGAENVLISLGGEGAMLVDAAGRVRRVPALTVEVTDTVGAGDSMVAGFLAGYPQGSDYALRLANAAGAATAASAHLATREKIEELLR